MITDNGIKNLLAWLGWESTGVYSWEFLVGCVPPGSPNPDPVSDEENVIFHTISDLISKK